MALPPFATAATRTDRHAPRDANPTPPTIDLGEFLRYQELAAQHAKAAELSPFSHKVPLWIVSNRGTVELNDNSASKLKLNPLRNTFELPDDAPLTHVAGGLTVVTSGPLQETKLAGREVYWTAHAQSAADKVLARQSGEVRYKGTTFRFRDPDPAQYKAFYATLANSRIWPAMHDISTSVDDAVFDAALLPAHELLRDLARDIVRNAPNGSLVLLQDYQLAELPGYFYEELFAYNKERASRGELEKVLYPSLFWHIPWAPPKTLLKTFNETPDNCPNLRRILSSIELTPIIFHSEMWAKNYVDTFRAVLGRPPRIVPSVQPAFVNAQEIHEFAQSDTVEAELAKLDEQLGDNFQGEIIALLGRADPKNGLLNGIRAFRAFADSTIGEKPALIIGAPRSRPGIVEYDEEWNAINKELASLKKECRDIKVIQVVGLDPVTNKNSPDIANYGATLAAFRRCTIFLNCALAGGRDITMQEAAAAKQVGDEPPVLVSTASAATQETIRTCVPELPKPHLARPDNGVLRARLPIPGAMVVKQTGFGVSNDDRVRRYAEVLADAVIIRPTDRRKRFEAIQRNVFLENPRSWLDAISERALSTPGALIGEPRSPYLSLRDMAIPHPGSDLTFARSNLTQPPLTASMSLVLGISE